MTMVEGLQDTWRPALALLVGLPLALLVLNEWLAALRRGGHALAAPVAFLRNAVVPALGLMVLLDGVLALPDDDLSVRIAHTILWVVLVAGALSLANALLFEGADRNSWRSRVPKLLRDLVRLGLVLGAAAFIYAEVWGADLSGALTALGLGGLVLGLALQEPLGNLFSGIMLLMERPFEVGDEIEVGGTTGVVQEINWRSVHVLSPGGILRVPEPMRPAPRAPTRRCGTLTSLSSRLASARTTSSAPRRSRPPSRSPISASTTSWWYASRRVGAWRCATN